MYACMHACMYVCTYVVCMYMCACMHTCMSVTYIYIYIYVCVCVCVCLLLFLYVCMYVYMFIFVCMYIYIYIYIYICVCVCVCEKCSNRSSYIFTHSLFTILLRYHFKVTRGNRIVTFDKILLFILYKHSVLVNNTGIRSGVEERGICRDIPGNPISSRSKSLVTLAAAT